MIHELVIPKDTTVCVGVLSSNTNKAIWGEDAMEWKPERWLSPLPKSVTDAKIPGVYSNLMTFMGGGRACMYVMHSSSEASYTHMIALTQRFQVLPAGNE